MTHIIIHNAETNEVIEREMNAQELAQLEIDEQQEKERKEAEAAKVAKKLAAEAKLAALGLEPDDLRVLGL
jgi:hypothetical protein